MLALAGQFSGRETKNSYPPGSLLQLGENVETSETSQIRSLLLPPWMGCKNGSITILTASDVGG